MSALLIALNQNQIHLEVVGCNQEDTCCGLADCSIDVREAQPACGRLVLCVCTLATDGRAPPQGASELWVL